VGRLTDLIERFQHGNAAAEEARQPRDLDRPAVPSEEVRVCTTCGACLEVCPVLSTTQARLPGMRAIWCLPCRKRYPESLVRTFKNLEQNGKPWGLGADRAHGLGGGPHVPTLDREPDAEWLLWVSARAPTNGPGEEHGLALVDILRQAGVNFAVLGMEETVLRRCGPAHGATRCCTRWRRSRNRNHERQEGKEDRHVLPALSACTQNRVPTNGRQLPGPHHSQLIAELVEQG